VRRCNPSPHSAVLAVQRQQERPAMPGVPSIATRA
jgi:hypothetical protein